MTSKEMVESGTKLNDGSAAYTRLPFVHRLYLLLNEVEAQGNEHIISWIGDGKAFRIHDPFLFESSIQPKYFRQTKLESFIRQVRSMHRFGVLRDNMK